MIQLQRATSLQLIPIVLSPTGIGRKERLIRTDSRLAIVEFISELYQRREVLQMNSANEWSNKHVKIIFCAVIISVTNCFVGIHETSEYNKRNFFTYCTVRMIKIKKRNSQSPSVGNKVTFITVWKRKKNKISIIILVKRVCGSRKTKFNLP